MEADFRDKAVDVFGVAVRDQALFTVWTLRKISETRFADRGRPRSTPAKKPEDNEYCTNFNVATSVAHFALDCLQMGDWTRARPIYPEATGKADRHHLLRAG